MAQRNWTREELIVALNLYCKIPFKESRASHPLVIEYAKLIGRSPAAMNLKIGNLGRFDPLLQAMDEVDNGLPIAHQTNAMYDCVMDVYFPFDKDRDFEVRGVDIISALEEWVNDLF